MGWQCMSEDCSVRLYSISDDLGGIVNNVLNFLFNISTGLYAVLLLMIVGVFTLYIFYYIKRAMSFEDA